METLQLKHLACYLPYWVQVSAKTRYDREERIGRMTELTFESNHGDWVKVFFDDVYTFINTNTYEESSSNAHYFFFGQDVIKPLLIPMSELTKEQWESVFIACNKNLKFDSVLVGPLFATAYLNNVEFIRYWYEEMGFSATAALFINQLTAFETLFSLHVDVRGLIEKGLALSKLEHGR